MSNEHPDISRELIQKAAEKYSEVSTLRAAIQLIPYIGSPLDTLIGGEGQKIQQRRIAHFIEELNKRLESIESPRQLLKNEEPYDLVLNVFAQVAKSRSIEKRVRFAQIISREVATAGNVEEAELAMRLIGDLDDFHILILQRAVQAPVCNAPYDGLRVFVIGPDTKQSDTSNSFPVLSHLFPDIEISMLRLICSELISKGLVKDEGVGRFGTAGMQYFVATDLATWLFTWIND